MLIVRQVNLNKPTKMWLDRSKQLFYAMCSSKIFGKINIESWFHSYQIFTPKQEGVSCIHNLNNYITKRN